MAYAALVSLEKVLEQILDHDQQSIFLHEKQQIKSLHENIVFLLIFLEDFPGEAGNLESRITIAANQAEDIIEYHISNEILSPKTQLKHHNWQSLYQQLQKSIKEIDSILKEVMQIKSSSRSKDLSHSFGSFPSRLPPNGKDTVVGFEEDLMEIKVRLCGESSRLQIIPIFGMGGIGKTTLARYAHDDSLTVHHFDVRIWVTVSQKYSARRILLGLLCSIDASNKELYERMDDDKEMDEKYLVEQVYKYLKGRRYLIVMDDMWHTSAWDDVRMVFPDDFNGSRIIITTRELDVASYIDSSIHPYQMHLMDVDQSWSLLKEKVFAQENCPPELEEIGKLIAENCRGLPSQLSWKNIERNVKKAVNTSDEKFSEILSLSYTHLPHHLRPCFLYMGGFPEDYEINVSRLVKLWAAEGFLKSNRSKNLEEVAEEYLEDLAKRSLVLVIKKRSNGKIKAVKIHDLLRDLCLRKARDEKFLHVINEFPPSSSEGIENSRRLSILSYILGGFPNIDGSPIHSILLFRHTALNSWKSFGLLRVVDAMSVLLTSYPVEISELFHLRFLAFTFESDIKVSGFAVPGSLSKLQNLQTLIIRQFGGFSDSKCTSYLPFGIWTMPQLRHLILLDGFLPDPFTEPCLEILALENLHTLSRVTSFTCSKRILEMIPNLKKLGIFYSFSDILDTGWSKFGLNNLVHLRKLEKLNIYAEPYNFSRSNFSKNLVAFPVTLKKLTLSGCLLPWEDMTIVGSLPNLEEIKLKRDACHGFDHSLKSSSFDFLQCRNGELQVLLIYDTHFNFHFINPCYKLLDTV
ncbi:hypothetical protein Pfo_020323 [Paulownia fortunei]|nr:hypothetical protein Pfo_020323 [Paulownia fortunei]